MPAARAHVRRDAPTSDRVAALDALRVVSMAAVVALHASAAYMTVRIPGLIWLVNEPAARDEMEHLGRRAPCPGTARMGPRDTDGDALPASATCRAPARTRPALILSLRGPPIW